MLLIYSPVQSPRLSYIAGELFEHWYGCRVRLCYDIGEYKEHKGAAINYGRIPIKEGEIRIQPAGLLEETGVPAGRPPVSGFGEETLLYPSSSPESYPFDLFSAAFWLLTRAEEYGVVAEDDFGRFPAEKSLADSNGFLNHPLLLNWTSKLLETLRLRHPEFVYTRPEARFLTTIDVDQAFAFRHRGFWQQFLTAGNSLLNARFWAVSEQIKSILGRTDTYDSFDWLKEQEKRFSTSFLYFFLLAEKKTRFDPNLTPATPALQKLIQSRNSAGQAGLHPSFYATTSPALLEKEKQRFESICGAPPSRVRQHYIRLKLPATYQNYEMNSFREDYSMGYPEKPGFRASTSLPFRWFDLQENRITNLKVFPFCIMEGSFADQSPQHFLQHLNLLHAEVSKYGGYLIQIWHNHTVNDNGIWKGWKPAFEESLKLLHSRAS